MTASAGGASLRAGCEAERTGRFLIAGKWIELPVMGAFELRTTEMICAWRGYRDMAQLQRKMAPDEGAA